MNGNIVIPPGASVTVQAGETWIEIALAEEASGDSLVPIAQRDVPWRDDLLGFSRYTIGGMGCALTCASIISRQLEQRWFPGALNDALKDAGGFYGAHLAWSVIPEVVPGLVFDGITNWTNGPADLGEIYARLDQYPLILWVDFRPGGGQDTHFVIATGRAPGDDLFILDPWDGYAGRLLLRYGARDWTLERAIYGMRPLYVGEAAQPAALALDVEFDGWPYRGLGGIGLWLKRNQKHNRSR